MIILEKLYGRYRDENSLVLTDILPKDTKTYDKNRPPKYSGQPTVVKINYFYYVFDLIRLLIFGLIGLLSRDGSVNRYHQWRVNGKPVCKQNFEENKMIEWLDILIGN